MSQGKALFLNPEATGENLWVTDGTKSGTRPLDLTFDPGFKFFLSTKFYAFGSKLLFATEETSQTGGEPNLRVIVSGGSAASTSAVTIRTDVNDLLNSIEIDSQAAKFDDKFLIFDQFTSIVGKLPTAKFLVTDGTKSETRTFTITGDPLPPVGAPSFDPGPFLSLGKVVLFAATDRTGLNSLWRSNGTAAGTVPLAVKGADDGLFGLQPADLTAFGKAALFSGNDSSGQNGLWITNGSAGGTHELAARPLASVRDITVAGDRAFYSTSGELWVTDGTIKGTKSLGVGVQILTAFGSKVLDAVLPTELFVSDGTTTSQLNWSGSDPSGFIALGNKVLFEALNTSNKLGLWVTDGTSDGTSEIRIPQKDVDIFGIFGAGVSFQGAVIGSEVVFSGTNHLGVTGLWVTDGTVHGTRQIDAPISASDLTSIPPPPPPPVPSGLALARASDSGTKGDRITNVTRPTITGKGVVGDKVTLRDGGKTIGTAVVEKPGTWSVTPKTALAAGVHTLTATETSKTLGVSPASAALKLTIKTSAAVPSALGFAVGADKGAAGDVVTVGGKGEAGDRVTVFDGTKALRGVTVGAGGVWSVALSPLALGAHSLSAGETDVAGNTSAHSRAQSLTIAHAAPNAVTFVGTAGADRFTGGAGNDVFQFSAANLAAGDIVKGGGGNDRLKLTSAGPIHANGVGGVETYVLFNGAGNALTLVTGNFAGVAGGTITVDGGNGADKLSEAGVAATDKAILNGGAGSDTLVAGRNAVLKGGAGKDMFELTVPGSPANLDHNTIADFAHGTDKIAFSKAGFNLGSAPVAASLFAANKGGSFTTAAQRFAYDTATGDLFYDGRGNAAGSTRLEIATLAHAPTLATGDITLVA